MQRGTRFFIFDVPSGALCWAQRGRRKYCELNVFWFVYKEGHVGSDHQMDPEEQNLQNMSRKWMVCEIALGGLWHPFWVVIFLSYHRGASRRPRWICQNCFKSNAILMFFGRLRHKYVKSDVIASAGECHKIVKNTRKIYILHIFLETAMVPIWHSALFIFFSLPILGPKMASLKLSKMI